MREPKFDTADDVGAKKRSRGTTWEIDRLQHHESVAGIALSGPQVVKLIGSTVKCGEPGETPLTRDIAFMRAMLPHAYDGTVAYGSCWATGTHDYRMLFGIREVENAFLTGRTGQWRSVQSGIEPVVSDGTGDK